jgi:hypothetical protein
MHADENRRKTPAKMTHVPFTGAGPAVVALLRADRRGVVWPATVLQQVKAALRVLAHWGNSAVPLRRACQLERCRLQRRVRAVVRPV